MNVKKKLWKCWGDFWGILRAGVEKRWAQGGRGETILTGMNEAMNKKTEAMNKKINETILIQVSGQDKPGLLAALTSLLAESNVRVLDIGQTIVHKTLVLGLLVELPQECKLTALQNAVQTLCDALALHLRFTPVVPQALEQRVDSQDVDRYVVTVLGQSIETRHLAEIGTILADQGLNVDRIERLSGRMSRVRPALASPTLPPSTANACMEFHVSGRVRSEAALRAAFLDGSQAWMVDIVLQRETIFRRNRRLFAFDMDSTLIQGEVIDELARMAGVVDKVQKITEAAMRGELEFKESFRRRVALLRGLPEARVLELLDAIPLVEGADHLIATLKLLGYKTAILSGGFNFFAKHLQQRLGIDYVYANDLEIADGIVTGRVTTEIVDGAKKAQLLREIAMKENILLEQVVAVGDGANDLPMLGIAGMGIAFRAKPIVRQKASHAVGVLGLDSLLYLVGVRDRDMFALHSPEAAEPLEYKP